VQAACACMEKHGFGQVSPSASHPPQTFQGEWQLEEEKRSTCRIPRGTRPSRLWRVQI